MQTWTGAVDENGVCALLAACAEVNVLLSFFFLSLSFQELLRRVEVESNFWKDDRIEREGGVVERD